MRFDLLLPVSLFVLPAAAGWALHDWFHPHEPAAVTVASLRETSSPRRDAATARPLPRTPEEFEVWAKERANEMVPEGMGYRMPLDFSGWTTAQLQSALEEGLRDPGIALFNSDALHTANVLLGELTRRDPDAALAWLQKVPSQSTMQRLSGGLCLGWPAERAEELMSFVGTHREIFQSDYGYTYGNVLTQACESAVRKGPQELAKLLKEGKDNQLQAPYGAIQFPPGFDFKTMALLDVDLRKANSNAVSGYLVHAWMRQSTETAFDGLVALSKEGKADLVSSVLWGLYQPGEQDAGMMDDRAKRIGAKAGELDPEQRQEMNAKIAKTLADQPERLARYCQGYSDPQMKAEAGVQAAAQLLPSKQAEAIDLLDSVCADSQEKIDRLNDLLPAAPPQPSGRSGLIGPEKRARIIDRLTSWGMSVDEASATIERFEIR